MNKKLIEDAINELDTLIMLGAEDEDTPINAVMAIKGSPEQLALQLREAWEKEETFFIICASALLAYINQDERRKETFDNLYKFSKAIK